MSLNQSQEADNKARFLLSKKENTGRMMVDGGLANVIGVFNAIGFILVVASPMIVDPHLTTHVQYPDRHYPVWIWALTVVSVPVLLVTRLLLKDREVSRRNYFRAFLPLFIPGMLIAALAFRPERPHLGAMLLTVAYCVLSAITVGARQSRDDFSFINDPRFEFLSRLERLRATVSSWQLVSVYGMAAYIGFAAVALSVLWTITGYMVRCDLDKMKCESEKFFLGESFVAQVIVYSICVATGPLHECFEMMSQAVRKVSEIKEAPSEATNSSD